MKANSNQAVIRTLGRLGAGMDVVSGGELKRALAAGIPGERIMFSGVGKTEAEHAAALEAGVFCINVESEPEVAQLSRVATSLGKTAHISFRVNPDVDARTHAKISTGKKGDKFGIPISTAREAYARAAKLPGIHIAGIDMHIGSQITDLQPFERCLCPAGRIRRHAARRRPRHRPCRWSAAASASPIASTTSRPPSRCAMPRW